VICADVSAEMISADAICGLRFTLRPPMSGLSFERMIFTLPRDP